MIPLGVLASSAPRFPTGPTDPLYAYVVSLLNFGGADGSTVFTDAKGKVWTAHGDAQINDGGLLLSGSGGYISTPNDADFHFPGDFCVEKTLLTTSPATFQLASSKYQSSYTPWGIGLFGSKLQMLMSTTGVNWASTAADTANFPASTLVPVALSREGTQVRLFKFGLVVATATVAGALDINTGAVTIGNWVSPSYYLAGRVKGWRVTKGHHRHDASGYTPEALPLPTA